MTVSALSWWRPPCRRPDMAAAPTPLLDPPAHLRRRPLALLTMPVRGFTGYGRLRAAVGTRYRQDISRVGVVA